MIKKLLLTSVACLSTLTFLSAEEISYSNNTITHGNVTYKLSSTDVVTKDDDNPTVNTTFTNINLTEKKGEAIKVPGVGYVTPTLSYNISFKKRQETTYTGKIITTYVLPNQINSTAIDLSNWSVGLDENKPEWPNTDITRLSFLRYDDNSELWVISNSEKLNEWKQEIDNIKTTIEQQTGYTVMLGSAAKKLDDYSCFDENIIDECYYLVDEYNQAYPIKDLTISNTKVFNYTNCYHNYEVLEIPSTFAIGAVETGVTNVTSVTIPNTVTSIDDAVFAEATSVTTIALQAGSANFALDTKSTDGVDSYYLYHKNGENKDKLLTTCNSTAKRLLELPADFNVANKAIKGSNLTIVSNDASKIAAYDAGYIYNAGVNAKLVASTSLDLRNNCKVMENLNINNSVANCLVFFSETSANGKTISGNNVVVDGTCANFVITDREPYNNTVRNFEATNVTYKRSLNQAVWSSVVLPCNFKNTNLKVADLTAFDGNTFTYTILSNQEMSSCVPYMIKNTGSNVTAISSELTGVNVKMSDASVAKDPINGATFKGTFSVVNGNQTANNFYTYNSAGTFVYVAPSGTSKIMPFHSYIEVEGASSSAPSIRYIDEFTGTTEEIDNQTAIEAIEENATVKNNMFDLNGNRVAAPVKGQMYINNGKKFIVK